MLPNVIVGFIVILVHDLFYASKAEFLRAREINQLSARGDDA